MPSLGLCSLDRFPRQEWAYYILVSLATPVIDTLDMLQPRIGPYGRPRGAMASRAHWDFDSLSSLKLMAALNSRVHLVLYFLVGTVKRAC